ncbi:NAD-dependent epimerase/dehydratase family protein [Myroides odoratimimus]|uniref:NAD-dependent epimerase/dehydratase family protein n=1 Tax=Myroides odoratimimus TaxID=76832 RepID=UPI00257678A4|nr:NAD-dependent epimerase/dehydratase family protein [Myroides odoratimimus]MDM1448000.1 NAD-dependent epimerase/dehydratase family protein [Myroides odoratimimus]
MNKQVLIFGSSGFIGQSLFHYLKSNFPITNSSLRDLNNLREVKTHDIIINLVGKAHDHKGEATERDFDYANYELVKELYKVFEQSDAKVFIHISSIAAIEETGSSNALTEEMGSNPQSWYGLSKRKAEEYLLNQDIPEGKKVIILRPTMVHGPGDKGNLTLLYKLISKGLPYPLAKFDNRRSFLSIDNFNFFIEEIINNIEHVDSGIYHICDDTPIATSSIISIIGKVTDKKVLNFTLPKGIVKSIAKVGDMVPIPLNSKRLSKMTSDLVVSNEKIKKALGIGNLPVSAEKGLEKTISSFKKK